MVFFYLWVWSLFKNIVREKFVIRKCIYIYFNFFLGFWGDKGFIGERGFIGFKGFDGFFGLFG